MIPPLLCRALVLGYGVCYPTYATFKALRGRRLSEYVAWLMYWSVFTPLLCLQPVSECLLSGSPLYYDALAALVIWLAHPSTKGAALIYRKYIHPNLRRNEHKIDEYSVLLRAQSSVLMNQLCAKAIVFAKECSKKASQHPPEHGGDSMDDLGVLAAFGDADTEVPGLEELDKQPSEHESRLRKKVR